jgi:hypothetical protein
VTSVDLVWWICKHDVTYIPLDCQRQKSLASGLWSLASGPWPVVDLDRMLLSRATVSLGLSRRGDPLSAYLSRSERAREAPLDERTSKRLCPTRIPNKTTTTTTAQRSDTLRFTHTSCHLIPSLSTLFTPLHFPSKLGSSNA